MAKFQTDYQSLAHHWVYNTDYSECYGYRMFSEDDYIYSYGRHFTIARKVKDRNGNRVFLVNSCGYSNTTAKHVSCVRQAIPDYETTFEVPGCNMDHDVNIQHYLTLIEVYAIKESRAKSVDYTPDITYNLDKLKQYINVFKVDKRKFTKSIKKVLNFNIDTDDIKDLIFYFTGINNERVRVNKKKAKIASKKRIALQAKQLEEWLNFERDYFYQDYGAKIRLRYNKEYSLIETSNSAHITLDEALKLHSKIQRAEKLLGSKVGQFSIVEASKVFKIGCTTLTREVLNDMCKQLNLKEVF